MKHLKEGLFLLPAIGVCLAAVAGYQLNIPIFPPITFPEKVVEAAEVETETEEIEETEEAVQAEVNYEDGIYYGVGTGFSGEVSVEVIVKGHQITDITVLSYQDDTAFFQRAKALIDKILQAQTWEVDVVSGATYSSRGILEAVKNALTGTDEKSEPVTSDEGKEVSETVYEGGGVWRDGVYHGVGRGYGGNIGVDVTIAEQRMTDIQVTEHGGETPSYYERATEIIGRILAEQNPNVDTVSGATYSSGGIREAVIFALTQAAGAEGTQPPAEKETQGSVTEEKGENKKEESQKENPKGTPKDGVYTGSAQCEMFGYTISLKVKFKDGKAAAISGLEVTDNEDENNEAYWKAAWKPMVKRILKKQSAQVDAVSGATYSSNAIADAYLDAYGKAVKANGGKAPKKDTKEPEEETEIPDEPMEDSEISEPSGTVKDGTYTVSAVCTPDSRNAFQEYQMTADVTFLDGKLTAITNFTSSDETNRNYYLKAANGNKQYTGVVAQLLDKQSALGINAVSGATCSSKTIRKLYLLALEAATGKAQTEPEEEMQKPEEKPEPGTETVPDESTGEGTEADDAAEIRDGTYRVTVTVKDVYEEFWDYDLTADVVFFGGKLADILNMEISDESNWGYCQEAADGIGSEKGIIRQLQERQNDKVDVISGATCSSKALIGLYKKALEMAKQPLQ